MWPLFGCAQACRDTRFKKRTTVRLNYPEGFVFPESSETAGEGKHFKRWSKMTAGGRKTPIFVHFGTFISPINYREQQLIGACPTRKSNRAPSLGSSCCTTVAMATLPKNTPHWSRSLFVRARHLKAEIIRAHLGSRRIASEPGPASIDVPAGP